MFSATSLKIIFAISIYIVIIIAGWYPFRKRIKDDKHIDFPIGETLATGVFLGAALLHMLPESNTLFKSMGYDYPFAYIITGAVFLIFLWFEHLGKELYHHHSSEHPAFAILAWAMLSVHSIMLGAALGLAQYNSMIIMLFLAIITHKWARRRVRHRAAPPAFRTPSATDATRPGPGRCGSAGGDRHDLGCRGGRPAGRPAPVNPCRR